MGKSGEGRKGGAGRGADLCRSLGDVICCSRLADRSNEKS